jgi:hypothetical protein
VIDLGEEEGLERVQTFHAGEGGGKARDQFADVGGGGTVVLSEGGVQPGKCGGILGEGRGGKESVAAGILVGGWSWHGGCSGVQVFTQRRENPEGTRKRESEVERELN